MEIDVYEVYCFFFFFSVSILPIKGCSRLTIFTIKSDSKKDIHCIVHSVIATWPANRFGKCNKHHWTSCLYQDGKGQVVKLPGPGQRMRTSWKIKKNLTRAQACGPIWCLHSDVCLLHRNKIDFSYFWLFLEEAFLTVNLWIYLTSGNTLQWNKTFVDNIYCNEWNKNNLNLFNNCFICFYVNTK